MSADNAAAAPMLAGLIAQAAGEGADVVTLRALVEEASELGAGRALKRMGLHDGSAVQDIGELRQVLQAWRDAKRAARMALVGGLLRGLLAALLGALAVKFGLQWLLLRQHP
ncbi:MAG: DUF6127 family protein [Sphingomonadaceae bacterium]|nr:DUF6127 family protein [Sphingomonadaceae bacterium]